ncbi:MAG: hypothetical protein V4719_06265 [Planctomycetota bacterium]
MTAPMSSLNWLRWIVACLIWIHATAPHSAHAANENKLVYVPGSNGKPSSLVAKVVVVSSKATLAETPMAQGEPIEPWAIFFRIKNEDGTSGPINGRLRVGDSKGLAVGWIGEKDLRAWSTRFILDPINPQGDRAFELQLAGGGSAKQNAVPDGKRRYALISNAPETEKGDDSEYPVIVYAGNVQGVGQGGTLAKQRNELRDVKLEIVFVIESTDFMLAKYDKNDPKRMFDYLKDMIRETIGTLRSNEKLKGAVRLGFVEYQDNVPKARFTSRTTCDLTDDHERFSASLDRLEAIALEDDWPEDVLAGLNEAIQNATWSSNSVKHIILLGVASCQLAERGQNPNQYGGVDNILTSSSRRPRGFNSTRLTLGQLLSRSKPQGGGDSKARMSKNIHTLLLGRDLPAVDQSVVELSLLLTRATDDQLTSHLAAMVKALGQEKAVETASLCGQYQLIRNQRELALAQYQQLSGNNGEFTGIFQAVEPNAAKVTEAARNLSLKLQESFKDLENVREGNAPAMDSRNELSQPLFTLVGAAAEKFKDTTVYEGTATVRDARGREVAAKKVMVSEVELTRLKSTLDGLFTRFKGKTSKVDRQDVGGILNDLKEVLTETSTGQELAANVKLKDLISDLPLRTAALDTSPADLALMTTEAFKQWLDRLQSAVFRIDDLLSSRQDWLTLSEKAVNDKFTFLRVSELP